VLPLLISVVKAVAGRLLLAAVFGVLALLLAQYAAGNMAEQIGGAPPVTPTPAAEAPPRT
jgi:hypothetical protein